MSNPLTVLLIEDNLTIASQVCDFLEGVGWQVDHTVKGAQGIELALAQIYDVVVLDLNLPDIDGLEVCKSIKQQALTYLPILMLTARDAFEDKADGFGMGADDYVTKPFELRELVLRCSALARRNNLHNNKILRVGNLEVDTAKRTASRSGQVLQLTKIGFEILSVLAQAYPQPVTRSVLIHKVWADDPPDSDALRTHIFSLRSALDKPFNSPMLTTIINVGYKLEIKQELKQELIQECIKEPRNEV